MIVRLCIVYNTIYILFLYTIDGGDCCEQSCVDSYNACGVNGYKCLDPLYANMSQTPSMLPTPSGPTESPTMRPDGVTCVVEYPSYIGDGWCDRGDYNTEDCGWGEFILDLFLYYTYSICAINYVVL